MQRIHIVPGDSGAGSLRMALASAADDVVVAVSDALSCGPLEATRDLAVWEQRRRQFWGDALDEDPGPLTDAANAALRRKVDTVTLWIGYGVGDQIALPWFCWFTDLMGVPTDRLQVVQFPHDFVAGYPTPSLGMLSPELIQKHPPTQRLGVKDVAVLRRAWAAITADEPTALSALLSEKVLPQALGTALSRAASRYPNETTGLNHWDYSLLKNSRDHSPRAVHVMAHTLSADGWDIDPVGDGWLFWRLKRLADASRGAPLVALHGDSSELRSTTVELTAMGSRVLEGSTNALDVRAIDDWVFGVHLDAQRGGTWVTSVSSLDAPLSLDGSLQLSWRPFALPPRS